MKTNGRRVVYEDSDYLAQYDFAAMHERDKVAAAKEADERHKQKEDKQCPSPTTQS